MKESTLLTIAGVLSAGLFAFVIVQTGRKATAGSVPLAPPVKADISRSQLLVGTHSLKGNPSDKWVLVEFFDYQCPPCRQFAYSEREILGPVYDHISISAHFLPLAMHPYAKPSALMAEVADRKGKLLRFHHDLMDRSFQLSVSNLQTVGDQIGVSLDSALSDKEAIRALRSESELAHRLKVDGTPSFFLCDPRGAVWKLRSPAQAQSLINPLNS